MKIVTVDLNHRSGYPRLFARLVWQQLFDIYRHPMDGGDLTQIDDMLCDLYCLTRYFEKYESFTIYWKYYRGWTNIQEYNDYEKPIYEISFDIDTYIVTIKPAWTDE